MSGGSEGSSSSMSSVAFPTMSPDHVFVSSYEARTTTQHLAVHTTSARNDPSAAVLRESNDVHSSFGVDQGEASLATHDQRVASTFEQTDLHRATLGAGLTGREMLEGLNDTNDEAAGHLMFVYADARFDGGRGAGATWGRVVGEVANDSSSNWTTAHHHSSAAVPGVFPYHPTNGSFIDYGLS